MSMQDIFVYLIVACCLIWAGRRFYRQVIRRKDHSGGCGGCCSGCSGCALHKELDSLKKRACVSDKTPLRLK